MVHGKVLRFILDLSPMHSVTSTVFETLNIINVDRRVKQMRLNHVFNIVHNTAPSYLSLNFTSTSQHYSNIRSANILDFRLPSIKLCQDQTLYFNVIKDWNNLPTTIKQIRNRTSFKQSENKHLMGDLKLCEESSFFILLILFHNRRTFCFITFFVYTLFICYTRFFYT